MSDTMLLGVLRMPIAVHGDLDLAQLIGRAREAADRIEADARRIAELEADMAMLGEGMAALAAHLVDGKALVRELLVDDATDDATHLTEWCELETPADSLACLKAKCWKEAYLAGMEAGHHWTVEGGYVAGGDEEAADDYVADRQAEEVQP